MGTPLTRDVHLSHMGSPTKFSYSANGADEHYGGALLFTDTGGGVQAVPAAGDLFAGIVTRRFSIAAAGEEVEAWIDGIFKFPPCSGVSAADEGDMLIMDIGTTQSDNPADCVSATDATAAANDVLIGRILRVVGDGVWVLLNEVKSLYVATAGWGG